ncbi:MAG: hypothetical protein OSJ46_02225 [Duncaniella sp.]|mgnify:CR=1 FL=1|nr:hypothetical protein [Duncaniella sp.]HBI59341.1 hypothetical protein [Porphyromonadaceae bacterium]
MKKISTSSTISLSIETANAGESKQIATAFRPRRSTLDFVKQFARCYHFERNLPVTIPGFVLN